MLLISIAWTWEKAGVAKETLLRGPGIWDCSPATRVSRGVWGLCHRSLCAWGLFWSMHSFCLRVTYLMSRFQVVLLDTELPVRQAFHALYEQVCVS